MTMITVIRELAQRSHGHKIVEYRCDCGAIKTANRSDVAAGKVISCGCSKNQRIQQLGRAKFWVSVFAWWVLR
jgi:hypothetical protein